MQWNRRNILVAILILVLGFGSGGLIYVHQEGGWKFAMFRLEKWLDGLYGGETEITAEEEKFAKRETERIRKVILDKYPGLRVEGKDVPADQNGFLALFEVAKNPDLQSLMDSGIVQQVNEEKVDPVVIRKDLVTHHAIGKEIERIAALPKRSNVVDGKLIVEPLPAREVSLMGDYLILQARLAAMDGNETESFRFISLVVNLSEHLDDVESPHALSEVVRVDIRGSIREEFFRHILPAFEKSADLEKWASILEPQKDFHQRYGQMLVGEFRIFMESFLYPQYGEMPDPEQTALAYAKWVEASMHRYDLMSLSQAGASEYLPLESFTKGISIEGISLIKGIIIGSNLLRSMLCSVFIEHQHAAALDLLIREKAGEDLSKLTETYLMNPYTGKPFPYDPVARLLPQDISSPDCSTEVKLPW